MSVSEPFIRRPIATSLLGVALLIGGALGYWALPVSALPQVDFPTVQVTTQLPGASPDVVASLITAPLERQLGQIPSLSSMQSTSSFGVSQISLQFDLNRDIDGATQDVQAAINAAAGILPRTLPYPPTYAKVNPADAPVITLALTSETISLRAMSDIADTILGQRLSQISGVGRVSILGGLKPAVRVQADLARLAAYGISMEDLRNAIAGANVSGPKGSLDGTQQSYTIAANDQIAAAEAYKPIIIAYRNGAPVTIGDVAIIVDGDCVRLVRAVSPIKGSEVHRWINHYGATSVIGSKRECGTSLAKEAVAARNLHALADVRLTKDRIDLAVEPLDDRLRQSRRPVDVVDQRPPGIDAGGQRHDRAVRRVLLDDVLQAAADRIVELALLVERRRVERGLEVQQHHQRGRDHRDGQVMAAAADRQIAVDGL